MVLGVWPTAGSQSWVEEGAVAKGAYDDAEEDSDAPGLMMNRPPSPAAPAVGEVGEHSLPGLALEPA